MDKRLSHLLQVLPVAAAALATYTIANRLDSRIGPLIAVVATLNGVACWALRNQRPRVATFYSTPGVRQYLDFVCRMIGEQPPTEHAANGPTGELLLATTDDFADGMRRCQQVVRGQDQAIVSLLERLRDVVILRQRRGRDQSGLPPLGAFVLVGADGVGKRFLGRVLAKLLYRSQVISVFEGEKLGADAVSTLFGGKSSAGSLVEAVRRQPFQLILFDRLEAAPVEVIRSLLPILQHGSYIAPDTGRPVSFAQATFLFTVQECHDAIAELAGKGLGEKAWQQRTAELLTSKTPLDANLLAALSDIVHCPSPSDLVKAEVVSLLMQKEAVSYGIELSYVAPEILAAEVAQVSDATGFGAVPDRIRKVMHKPLVAAAQSDRKSIALQYARRERPSTEIQNERHA